MHRAILVPVGVLLGFGAGSAVLALGLATYLAASPALTSQAMVAIASLILGTLRAAAPDGVVGSVAVAVWRMLVTVCFVPVCLVAVVGEAVSARSLPWCAFGTAGVTAGLPLLLRTMRGEPAAPESGALLVLLVITGTVGGATYWLLAGRPAGRIVKS